jgi:hypothetical protein
LCADLREAYVVGLFYYFSRSLLIFDVDGHDEDAPGTNSQKFPCVFVSVSVSVCLCLSVSVSVCLCILHNEII